MRTRIGCLLACLAVTAIPARAQVVITNVPSINGDVGAWGTPSSGYTPNYGQVLTVPTGNPYLLDVTFYVQNPNLQPIPFAPYVYAWNGSSITGPALFSGAPQAVAPSGSAFLPVTLTFGSGLNLTAGSRYLVLMSTIGFPDTLGKARFLTAPENSYAGGTFAFNNETTFPEIAASGWNSEIFGDLGFTATFAPTAVTASVPEPETLTLAGTAFAVGLIASRRRKRSA